ncbi:MAG: HD-GYP domain-containing protein [Chromatiales bacterium]|nr:HD-GYP domain-containing protein [Chromatiales bacterium]
MLSKRVKVETANLERGMFVAQLDRPWLETPFLFQGFEIREDSEIRQLRQYCRHVYVDEARSSIDQARISRATSREDKYNSALHNGARLPPPRHLRWKVIDVISRFDPTGRLADRLNQKNYRNKVSVSSEAPRATRAYDAAVDTMNEVLEGIQQGRGVDVGRVRDAVNPMIDSVLRNQDAMAWLVYLRKRDAYTYQHSIASAVWAVMLGRHLGFDRHGLDTLAMGGMLLDIGKARVPDKILLKEGALTEEETAQMREHVRFGLEMVKATPGVNSDVLAMIASHHERHDGSGYPDGLAGNDIPVFGRISGLVDCFDAMTTRRPYAGAKSSYDAIRELNALAGTRFQRELVEQFVQALGMFPSGTLVELNTGEVGIVVEQNRVRRLRPRIMLLLDAEKRPLRGARTLDLRKLPSAAQDPRAVWIVQGLEPGAHGLDPKDYFV